MNKNTPRRAFCLLFACSAAIIFAFSTGCRQEQTPKTKEKITIAYSTSLNGTLVQIAFTNGYFAQEGLDAIPQPHAFGKLALDAVIAGKADLGTAADTPIMFAIMNGSKILILAVIQSGNKNEAIVARRDRGITKPADFKGKKIGLPLQTKSHFFVEAFLVVHGIDRKHVKIIDTKPNEMAVALAAGKVDAVSTWNPTSDATD